MTTGLALSPSAGDDAGPSGDGPLKGAVLAIVASDEEACERRAAPLRAAGAAARCAIVQVNALATLSAPGFDAVILDVGDEPETFVALARALHEDPRTRPVPVAALAAPHVIAARLEALGAVRVVSARDDAVLVEAVADMVEEKRAEARAAEYTRALEDRLRVALERLSTLRTEAQTVTHDARVLCGIVVGVAANLRDGIAGAIDPAQREHVIHILEAAKDTTALVDRFGATVRAQTDLPADTGSIAPPGHRRAHRRTLLDLVELARATVYLFRGTAEQKALVVDVEAPAPVSAWCDAMQVKQVVTNLLVNAMKFTPPGGRVTLEIRSAVPHGTTIGAGARHYAELVVRDNGPGIPEEDRLRVFERGTRLARDRNVPGSGIGLAVVREMVAAHGGTVQAHGAPGGGAEFVVRLPIDMRTRRDSSVVLIDDGDAARRILAALQSRSDSSPARPDRRRGA